MKTQSGVVKIPVECWKCHKVVKDVEVDITNKDWDAADQTSFIVTCSHTCPSCGAKWEAIQIFLDKSGNFEMAQSLEHV